MPPSSALQRRWVPSRCPSATGSRDRRWVCCSSAWAPGLGLWLVGVPAAWAIGLVAGLAEFVPYLGVILAGIPAIILGFGQGSDTGLWTLGVLIAVQQLQGNLVMPLLQNRMVDLPPAVTIFGIIAAGILFGVAGVLLATPLTIVVLVLIRRLYLGEEKEEVPDSAEPAPATTAE
jgi:predicted PurR-regulated permease PerM